MIDLLQAQAGQTLTENGGAAYVTTGSDCLDFFAHAGALRSASDDEIRTRFLRAFCENRDIALKLLFFARDVRGGLGERRVFRVILAWLADYAPETVRKNLSYIAEFGRFDDLFVLFGTACEEDMLALVKRQFEEDLRSLSEGGAVSLLGKWMPSVNTSDPLVVKKGKKLARYLGMKDAEYRKALSKLRAKIRILENYLREKDYTFDYEKQPSKALYRYRKAFMRNDPERYEDFLDAVSSGKKTMHTATLAPYELVNPFLETTWSGPLRITTISEEEKRALNTTWANLPVYHPSEDMLAVIDTSGSMYYGSSPYPASVALSLGLYLAEHNTGAFQNCFIEFSEHPRLIEIKGETFVDRLAYISSFSEIANTNLQAVFDLILKTAIKHKLPANALPGKLVVISDMEFDACVEDADRTVYEHAKASYEAAGYRLPEVIFWNVSARRQQYPVRMDENGTMLVSGVTPKLFDMIAGGSVHPYRFMMEVVESERYRMIRG
ncbi:MAG: DUF2828 family protein [Clostridia bacterium]|nr:DUF2828 family protein [Clostridia bacterium]